MYSGHASRFNLLTLRIIDLLRHMPTNLHMLWLYVVNFSWILHSKNVLLNVTPASRFIKNFAGEFTINNSSSLEKLLQFPEQT